MFDDKKKGLEKKIDLDTQKNLKSLLLEIKI